MAFRFVRYPRIVRYALPDGPIESAMRFQILEDLGDRVSIRLLDPARCGFTEALAPIETVSASEIVEVA